MAREMTGYILILFLFISETSYAQRTKAEYRFKSGTDLTKAIPAGERFQFDDFRKGVVYFLNGKKSIARLNYSLVHGEVQFIDSKKDTLLIVDNDFVDLITVGTDTFYYNREYGHVQLVARAGALALGQKQVLISTGNEKFAAYGQYSSTSAIASYSSFTNSLGLQQNLEIGDRVVLKRRSFYFWIDKNRKVSPASKLNLLKLYPRYKGLLLTYMKDNDTNFEDEQDLVAILRLASTF